MGVETGMNEVARIKFSCDVLCQPYPYIGLDGKTLIRRKHREDCSLHIKCVKCSMECDDTDNWRGQLVGDKYVWICPKDRAEFEPIYNSFMTKALEFFIQSNMDSNKK